MINRKTLIIAFIILIALAGVIAAVFINRGEKEEQRPAGEAFPVPIEQGSLKGKVLAPEKEEIRSDLVAPLGDAGVLTETSEFRIEYYSPDVFQVEIKTINIADARDKAIAWFKGKGFSEADICKLPVTFYLTPEVARKIEGSGVIFNTLPDFCQ